MKAPTMAVSAYLLPANPTVPGPTAGKHGYGGKTAFPCYKDDTEVQALTVGALRDIDARHRGTAVPALIGKVSGYKLP